MEVNSICFSFSSYFDIFFENYLLERSKNKADALTSIFRESDDKAGSLSIISSRKSADKDFFRMILFLSLVNEFLKMVLSCLVVLNPCSLSFSLSVCLSLDPSLFDTNRRIRFRRMN